MRIRRARSRRAVARVLVLTAALAGQVAVSPAPGQAATRTVSVKVFNASGTTLLHQHSATIDTSNFLRFAVATHGFSDGGSGEGQVAIDDLIVTDVNNAQTTWNFATAPTIVESTTGGTNDALRYDATNQRLLGIADSGYCSTNYESVNVNATIKKARFTVRRVSGDVGDGSFWNMTAGVVPSDSEPVVSPSCAGYTGRVDNFVGVTIEGDGDGMRNTLRGHADGTDAATGYAAAVGTDYVVEIDTGTTGSSSRDVSVKVYDASGATLLHQHTATITTNDFMRFAVATHGFSDGGSGEGQVAIDDLVVTDVNNAQTTWSFATAPTIVESTTGGTNDALRYDSANQRLLGIADSGYCSTNYESVNVNATIKKARFTIRRVTGWVGDGSYWNMTAGVVPSDSEPVVSPSCGGYTGRVDNFVGVTVEGDGDGIRNTLRGHADGTDAANGYAAALHTNYVVEIETSGGGTTPPPGPPNNNFANSVLVGGIPYATTVDTTGATRETGEPQPCGSIGATVWYKWTSPTTRTVTANTFGSSYDTVLAAYTGTTVGTLTNVACNDQFGGNQSQVTFLATAGTTYHFQVGGYFAATGNASISISGVAGPANDNFASATAISATPFAGTQSTSNASSEVGEPACSGGATSVWFRYVHPSTMPVRRMYANTFGSSYNTTLGVWQGTSVGSLTQVACNNDSRGYTQSQVGWLANPGQTYYLSAAGVSNATGSLTMRLIEGTIVAVGDSVVAGHGLGPNPTGYPNNPYTTYAQQVGDALKLRVANLAITGACAATYGSASAAPGTPDGCTTSILSNEINNGVPFLPTHVIVGVGGNDIEFATCLKGWLANEAEQEECRGTVLDTKLAALGTNLRTVLDQVNALSNPRPYVSVMGYYNFFADFDHLTQSGNQVCDFFMPAAISRDITAAATDHNSEYWRRHYVGPVQHDGYLYAEDVVTKLNNTISAAASAKGAQFVNPKAHFVGHDICAGPAIRGGSSSDVWVYGPDWNDKFWSYYLLPASYDSRAMPGDCPYPQPDHGDAEFHTVRDEWGIHYELHFRPNCLAHPTPAGAAQLANLVKPTLPLS